jgi:hypothetical protein
MPDRSAEARAHDGFCPPRNRRIVAGERELAAGRDEVVRGLDGEEVHRRRSPFTTGAAPDAQLAVDLGRGQAREPHGRPLKGACRVSPPFDGDAETGGGASGSVAMSDSERLRPEASSLSAMRSGQGRDSPA